MTDLFWPVFNLLQSKISESLSILSQNPYESRPIFLVQVDRVRVGAVATRQQIQNQQNLSDI